MRNLTMIAGQFNMFRFAGVILVAGLFLFSVSCGFLPKNACEISEAEAKTILESSAVIPKDKSNLPAGEKSTNLKVRACSYVTDDHRDVSSLRWVNFEFDNEQEARENFTRSSSSAPPTNGSKTSIAEIGNEAFLTREDDSGPKISIAVRKGKNVFMVIAHLSNSSEKSIEEIKSLSKKIADRTSN